jgi:hypothetical protein
MQNAPLVKGLIEGNLEDAELAFGVFIAYENRPAGQRAMQLFANLAQEHEANANFWLRPWRFDLLAEPEWHESATADARAADLLIIAAGAGPDLPTAVRNWLEHCLAERRNGGGVVALFGAEGEMDPIDSPRLRFLRQAAEKASLDFFAPSAASDGAAPENRQPGAEPISALQDHQPAESGANRHRGVNDRTPHGATL